MVKNLGGFQVKVRGLGGLSLWRCSCLPWFMEKGQPAEDDARVYIKAGGVTVGLREKNTFSFFNLKGSGKMYAFTPHMWTSHCKHQGYTQKKTGPACE